MKKVLTVLCLIAFVFAAKAQTDSTYVKADANKKTYIQKEEYCLMSFHQKSFSKKFFLNIDYGNTEQGEDLTLDNKPLLFSGAAEGLNYMAKQGWSLVNVLKNGDYILYYMKRSLSQ